MFGGVHDVEESEEGIESEFFNELFAWNVERNRFFPLTLRKPRQQKKGGAGGGEGRTVGGRRARQQANEEELLRQLAALRAGVGEGEEMDFDSATKKEEEEKEERQVREMPISMELPHVRFNAQLAVQEDVLYIYGGTFEKGDREFTFDDMYAVDLDKMDGCKEIFKREVEDWIVSEDEDEEEEDEEDYEDESDEEDEDGDVEMFDVESKKKFTPSKRGKKPGDDDISVATPSTAPSTVDEEEEMEATDAPVDDGLPHPRPFESRRDFFQRTSNEWQEILMTNLRWKNIQPESLTIKEIKSKAFELSEEKWWDCREEITALEDEQEAAGIGEVVSLADRGESGAGGGSGPRRR